MRMASGEYGMGMQGSYNPLVSAHSGLMGGSMGGFDPSFAFGPQGSLYAPRSGLSTAARPGDGQRRNKVKQRGRENVTGLAAPSRQRNTKADGEGAVQSRFSRIRVKLSSMKTLEKTSKSKSATAAEPELNRSKSKKRPAKDADDESRGAVKRQKSSKVQEEEETELAPGVHQIKHASDRPADGPDGGFCERNRYEKDQLIEVLEGGRADQGDWKLAAVRSCNEQGLYTVQYAPVEQNRHKQTGVEWANTRVACMHPACRQHQLFLAALPLFCDRCKKALIQAPQQRVYFQESVEAMEMAGSTTCIRLCNTCFSQLKTEQKNGGQKALMEETAKFTREHQQGERSTPLQLDQFEECQVPQRVEASSGPIMSTDVDGRWVQCEHCHKWYHWVCGMYDDTQYSQGRLYYCKNCKHHEPKTEQVRSSIKSERCAIYRELCR